MQTPTGANRKPFMIRYSGPIAWGFWVLSAFFTVTLSVARAPRGTFDDWWTLVTVLVGATIFPAGLLLLDHRCRSTGTQPLPRLGTYGLIAVFQIVYGLKGAQWAKLAGGEFSGANDVIAAGLFLVLVNSIGLMALWAHWTHEQGAAEAQSGEPVDTAGSD